MQCSRMAHVAASRKLSALVALARRVAASPAPAAVPRAAGSLAACGRALARTPGSGGRNFRVRAAASAAAADFDAPGDGRNFTSASAAGYPEERDPLAFEVVKQTCPGCGVCLQSNNPDKPGCVCARVRPCCLARALTADASRAFLRRRSCSFFQIPKRAELTLEEVEEEEEDDEDEEAPAAAAELPEVRARRSLATRALATHR
jgi:hypothetical protein